jgi:uncharacterized protein YegL
MKDNLTELVFILDRSGSMASMSHEAIGGFNAFLEAQKKVPGDAKLSLVLFDHEYTMVHNGKDIKTVEPLDDKTYTPRGTTALLDAIGRTVDDVGKRLHDTLEEDRPSKVLVAILTDGLENASHEYEKTKINSMISHQTDKYSWQFLFLAANQDAIAEGLSLGIQANNSMTYCADTAIGNQAAYATLSCAATMYRCTGNMGDIKNININTPDIYVSNTDTDPNINVTSAVQPDDKK